MTPHRKPFQFSLGSLFGWITSAACAAWYFRDFGAGGLSIVVGVLAGLAIGTRSGRLQWALAWITLGAILGAIVGVVANVVNL